MLQDGGEVGGHRARRRGGDRRVRREGRREREDGRRERIAWAYVGVGGTAVFLLRAWARVMRFSSLDNSESLDAGLMAQIVCVIPHSLFLYY